MVTYTISTVDSPAYKKLICGRTEDINRFLNFISCGTSVALFGERRIGKTSLLLMIRDIVNQQIGGYEEQLLDQELKSAIKSLIPINAETKAVFLDLLSLERDDNPAIITFINGKLRGVGVNIELKDNPQMSLVEYFEKINSALSFDRRLVVLLDEMECLRNNKGILGNLRSVIQSCQHICFVMAGAEYWHKQIKEKNSPLFNNVQFCYLKAPSQLPIEKYLIKDSLRGYLSRRSDLDLVCRTIVEWSECKPWYVQALCQGIIEIKTTEGLLSDDWKLSLDKRMQETVEYTLNDFYSGHNLDKESSNILKLLANKPGLTVKEISKMLGISEKRVWNTVVDLEALDKIRKKGSGYKIVGTYIESWGKKTQDIPKVKSFWVTGLRWVIALIFLLLAIGTYVYVHPPTKTVSGEFSEQTIFVRVPSSLEDDETGIAVVAVQNTGSTQLADLSLSLISSVIEYRVDNSNLVELPTISPGETKYIEFTFIANANNVYETKVFLADANNVQHDFIFDIAKRMFPVKKFWGLVSLFLITLSGLISKKEIGEIAATIISRISIGQNSETNTSK